MNNINKYNKLVLAFIDVFIILVSYILAAMLRFDFNIPKIAKNIILVKIPVIILIYLIIFSVFKLYSSLWNLAGMVEYINIVISNFISIGLAIIYIFFGSKTIPVSIVIMSGVLILLGTLGYRIFFRINKRLRKKNLCLNANQTNKKNILLIGAGDAASLVIKEIKTHSELNINIVGLIDDDKYKQHSQMAGVHIIGTTEDILEIVNEYSVDEIIFAIPSINLKEKKRILNIAKKSKAKLKTLPGVYELVDGKIDYNSIRDVDVADLLGREEIKLSNSEISNYLNNKVVMVTGGGGSIGGELCRQIVTFNPKQLVIVDIYENNAYDLQNELLREYPDLNLLVLIASVRDKQKINEIFKKIKPNVVFHAAAHKHVPLMETSPGEAIKNNVFGTRNVVKASEKYKVDKFILISTDKAVNPTNIMGATKRLCEIIVQNESILSTHTEFAAVRFGNVLGSNGSVIPLFKRQIENGGPVTLTHKDIIRYFMTIPEAVSLVLLAGSYAKGGEVFVLDMGDPVKIYDLAENMIRLSGYEPNIDIDIKVIGLRPGEKLYEELLMKEEGILNTSNDLIFIGKPSEFDEKELSEDLSELKELISSDDVSDYDIKNKMSTIVKTYKFEN